MQVYIKTTTPQGLNKSFLISLFYIYFDCSNVQLFDVRYSKSCFLSFIFILYSLNLLTRQNRNLCSEDHLHGHARIRGTRA
jgi:hypothetical protein